MGILTLMALTSLVMFNASQDCLQMMHNIDNWHKPQVNEMYITDSLVIQSQRECMSILTDGQKIIKLWIKEEAWKNWDYGKPEVDRAMCDVGKCLALHCLLYWKLEKYKQKYLTEAKTL